MCYVNQDFSVQAVPIELVVLLENTTSMQNENHRLIAFPALLENMDRPRPIEAPPRHALPVNPDTYVQVDLAESHVLSASLVIEHRRLIQVAARLAFLENLATLQLKLTKRGHAMSAKRDIFARAMDCKLDAHRGSTIT